VLIEKEHLAWLAGFIEADGSITLGVSDVVDKSTGTSYQRVVARVAMYNTDGALMARVAEIVDSLLRRPSTVRRYRPNGVPAPDKRPIMSLTVAKTADLEVLLTAIRPYLFSYKADRADYLLRWCAMRRPGVKAYRLDDAAWQLVNEYYAKHVRTQANSKRVKAAA
jgi:hypothetical protein